MEPTNRIKRLMEIAKEEAVKSNFRQRHGALLLKGSRIYAQAHNNASYNAFADRYKVKPFGTRHAEIQAILGLPKEITEGGTILVVRVNRKNNFANSYPCKMCIDVLHHVGVKRIIYSISNEEVGVIKL